jgi:hypothetical protein
MNHDGDPARQYRRFFRPSDSSSAVRRLVWAVVRALALLAAMYSLHLPGPPVRRLSRTPLNRSAKWSHSEFP